MDVVIHQDGPNVPIEVELSSNELPVTAREGGGAMRKGARRRWRGGASVRHVGRVREQLAAVLQREISDSLPEGWKVEVTAENLLPQTGAWRTNHRLDVMRWEGRVKLDRGFGWRSAAIGSWDTMTACAKGGCTVTFDESFFDVGAK